ncbi:glycerate kinase [Kibdelosporangium phytohabitans]|uniref:Glycerate kinase n=1 Tax=Kibdelosporangium phytohabitans TaxID=860235 RepID=A0A0N7F568_9PSEU|nr:glycerate kinase [Kibdelosporangium phytohabitans]ALG13391.1 glycerate kinase [Kibdelosporangium phytohabitans]MBE1465187.1 glycerate kinase [Kibdelosporangium phytohabitans]
MTILIAPDKFKGSLTAAQVADHLAAVFGRDRSVTLPVADGGDGTLDAAVSAGFHRVPVTAEDPIGREVETAYAEQDGVAVVEMADISGLNRLENLAPRTATSYGTGQLIAAALDAGHRKIIIGLGGSACTDGGAGLVQALGGKLHGVSGRGGAALRTLTGVDLSDLHPRLAAAEILVASDVDNPLLGPRGAAAVFGPQKGANPQDVQDLEAGLAAWHNAVEAATGRDVAGAPGAGAAGGVGYATLSVLNGQFRPGIDLVLDLIGFDSLLAGAELVITGEGSLDEQTLSGKAPAGVAARAVRAGIPVVAVAGRCLLTPDQVRAAGFAAAYALMDLEPDPRLSMANAGPLLETVARTIAADHLG